MNIIKSKHKTFDNTYYDKVLEETKLGSRFKNYQRYARVMSVMTFLSIILWF